MKQPPTKYRCPCGDTLHLAFDGEYHVIFCPTCKKSATVWRSNETFAVKAFERDYNCKLKARQH